VLEVPHTSAHLFDQILVVGDEGNGALELLERHVESVDGLEVQVVGGSSRMSTLGFWSRMRHKRSRAVSPPESASVGFSPLHR
jgi:hypothetical protein